MLPSRRRRRRSRGRSSAARPAGSMSGSRRSSTAPAEVGADNDVAAAARVRRTNRSSSRSMRPRAAMRLVAERARVIAEGAAACAVAAAVSPAIAARGHKKVVAVVSGGNIDLARFAQLVGACRRFTRLTLRILDRHVMIRPQSIPERLHRLPNSQSISGGRGIRRRAKCSGSSTTRCGARPRTTRCSCCAASRRSCSTLAAKDEQFLAVYDAAIEALDDARSGAGHVVAAPLRRRARADRLLLRRVRAASVAADLRRRPRRARRRSLQGSQRPRACRSSASASCIRRATSIRASRPKAGSRKSYERLKWADAPIEHAVTPDGKPCIVAGAARQPQRARAGLARAARPRQAVPARHRSRGERPVGSRAVGAPLRRRPRNARSSRKSSSASAAFAR